MLAYRLGFARSFKSGSPNFRFPPDPLRFHTGEKASLGALAFYHWLQIHLQADIPFCGKTSSGMVYLRAVRRSIWIKRWSSTRFDAHEAAGLPLSSDAAELFPIQVGGSSGLQYVRNRSCC